MCLQKIESLVQKIKNKKEEKIIKEKALGAFNKQNKQLCRKCGEYGHKPGDKRCPENKNEEEEKNKKTEKYENKNRKLDGVCYHCEKKGQMSKDCQD